MSAAPYSHSPNHLHDGAFLGLSPQRRQRAIQPPGLNTNVDGERTRGLGLGLAGQTPISTMSLSDLYTNSHYPTSTFSASPLAIRTPASMSSAYNPQQWGPMSATSPSVAPSTFGATHLPPSSRIVNVSAGPTGPDEPVGSPPPPYSPRRPQDQQNLPNTTESRAFSTDIVSPRTGSSSVMPLSASTTMSPAVVSGNRISLSPRSNVTSPNVRSPIPSHPITFPPPPPTSSSHRQRSSSRNHADKLLSSLASRVKTSITASPISAIETLHDNTAQILAQPRDVMPADLSARPPAARRAASTGCIGNSGLSRGSSNSPSQKFLEVGMPLPPPPPGPAPTIRSQSVNRSSETAFSNLSSMPPRTRRPPGQGTTLDTVPPTPADWREDTSSDQNNTSSSPSRTCGTISLHIDTSHRTFTENQADRDQYACNSASHEGSRSLRLRQDSISGGLIRSPAVRNSSAKGIRERRSESRNGKGRIPEDLNAIKDSSLANERDEGSKAMDMMSPINQGNLLSRRNKIASINRSGRSFRGAQETPSSSHGHFISAQSPHISSSNSTPRAESTRSEHFPRNATPTSPFPLVGGSFPQDRHNYDSSPALPPKLLPTSPPLQQAAPLVPQVLGASHTAAGRPVSHLLNMPNTKTPKQEPLVPKSASSNQFAPDLLDLTSSIAFASRARERHRLFAEREAAAEDDAERLHLFIEFILAESTIRRDRYATAFEAEELSLLDSAKGLFKMAIDCENCEDNLQSTKEGSYVQKRVQPASSTASLDSQPSSAFTTSSQIPESPPSSNDVSVGRPESSWWNDYVPCLSPIASMSIVTGQDEMDSRGRAPSRWWESGSKGSIDADAFRVLERSKRESKYMGVPREARDSPVFLEYGSSISVNPNNRPAELNLHPTYGPNHYPVEKTGWHEQPSPLPPPPPLPSTPQSAPNHSSDVQKLDISRLVTLPPPYPRHHPAVNNNHPDLAHIRSTVRSLYDFAKADAARQSHKSHMWEEQQDSDRWCHIARSRHSEDMQHRMDNGQLSQEQYDQAEAEINSKILEAQKTLLQSDFDNFQSTVVSPVHAFFSSSIVTATNSFNQLSSRLFTDAQHHSPNLPQEEGDEQPELLEKLTQLKWLFEARETLHKEIYSLLSERNDKYKAIVLLPYQHSNSVEKIADAESFFTQDAHDRKVTYEKEVLRRYSAFLDVIESNVVRGVEIQLSAFWDIAPPLVKLLHHVPDNLKQFQIQIPREEYEENPIYHEHELKYLYSLLGHAEKSSYQFIESQVNLLCLLHEIKEGHLAAREKVHAEQEGEGGAEGMKREEKRLTDDLKEKVRLVERLWGEALGGEMNAAKVKVKMWLLETGGWDDEDEEN